MKNLSTVTMAMLVAALVSLLTGCAGVRRLVTARVEIQSGTNVVRVIQPKDTTIERLEFNPSKGALVLQGYASAGNAAAIAAARAQSEAQAALFGRLIEFTGQLSVLAARAYGVPVPAAPPIATTSTNAAPEPEPEAEPEP